MEDSEIKRLISFHQERITHARIAIKTLQNVCQHNGLIGEYGANTGNYSPSDDSYWVDFRCPICECCWSEDQDQQKYSRGTNISKNGFKWTRK